MSMIFSQGNSKKITTKIDLCPQQTPLSLDAHTDNFLDEIVDLTTKICFTPVSLISIVSNETVWLKSQVGETYAHTRKNGNKFCGIFPKNNDYFEISDTDSDDIHKSHGFLIKGEKARFYAGAKIHLPKEKNLFGVLSVFDTCPRKLVHIQRVYLKGMADLVSEYLLTNKTV